MPPLRYGVPRGEIVPQRFFSISGKFGGSIAIGGGFDPLAYWHGAFRRPVRHQPAATAARMRRIVSVPTPGISSSHASGPSEHRPATRATRYEPPHPTARSFGFGFGNIEPIRVLATAVISGVARPTKPHDFRIHQNFAPIIAGDKHPRQHAAEIADKVAGIGPFDPHISPLDQRCNLVHRVRGCRRQATQPRRQVNFRQVEGVAVYREWRLLRCRTNSSAVIGCRRGSARRSRWRGEYSPRESGGREAGHRQHWRLGGRQLICKVYDRQTEWEMISCGRSFRRYRWPHRHPLRPRYRSPHRSPARAIDGRERRPNSTT